MNNREIEKILSTLEQLMELHGENTFKSRAYGRAARAVRASSVDVAGKIQAGEPLDIDGIGVGLTAEIAEIVSSGTTSELEDLMERTPNGLLDVLSIRGLGSKKVRALWSELGVESLDDLERNGRQGKIAQMKGFGAKTEQNILTGIQELRTNIGKVRLHTAIGLAADIIPILTSMPGVVRAEPTGRLRRGAEIFSILEFIVEAPSVSDLIKELRSVEGVSEVEAEDQRVALQFRGECQVRLHICDSETWPVVLHQSTGSSDYLFMFSIPLEERGYRIDGGRVIDADGPVKIESEEDLFALAEMQTIPPDLREGIDEVPLALEGGLSELVTMSDLKGVLHVHSVWSDGRNTIQEMAEGARERGYSYLLMCDHSKAAFYANGLDEKRLEEQGKEIDELNRQYDPEKFRVLKGIECDILADGTLDLAEDALAALDCVVISVHSSFTLPREAQTDRICRGLGSRYASILAHPTGRLLLTRKEYQVDLRRVISTATEAGKFVELNANPFRLDLDWRMVRFARRKGVLVGIDPDAHAVGELDYVEYGLRMARKAGLGRRDVLNGLGADAFLATIAKSRSRAE